MNYILKVDALGIKAGARFYKTVNSNYAHSASPTLILNGDFVEENPEFFTPSPDRLEEIVEEAINIQLYAPTEVKSAARAVAKEAAKEFSNATLSEIIEEIEKQQQIGSGNYFDNGIKKAISIIKTYMK